MVTLAAENVTLDGGTPLSFPAALSGSGKRYTAKITATAHPDSVTMSCIQTDPVTGVKRQVPVTHNSTFKQ
ncbi:MAG TPA: hypothetical protein HPP56_08990 [Nitrospirae bacterium]|nr:hypothetical protein [Nitrospirota bacterium]